MSVVTFIDYTPSPRADADPWTEVRVEESDAKDGVFTTIDTITLSPVDADPLHPIPRTFTSHNATLDSGWYRVTFLDAAGDEDPTDPIQHRFVPYLPSLADVGALLRARTKDDEGNELGTFTSATRPTAMEADRLIVDAADELVGALGGLDVVSRLDDNVVEEVWRAMRSLIALRAAMLIELSYFPEQVGTNNSPYDRYERMFTARLDTLTEVTGGMPTADWASLPVVSSTMDSAMRPGIFGADLAS